MADIEEVIDMAVAADVPTGTPPIIDLTGRDADLLSTGSTLLNLSLTSKPFAGLLKGFYYLLWGDSSAGKTIQSMYILAEATINPHFDDYDLIFDMPERGMLMDTDRLFGERLTERLRAPRYDAQGAPLYSDTLSSFYYNLDDRFKSGRPFIYVLDSMDPLEPDADIKKFEQRKKADRKEANRTEKGGTEEGEEEVKVAGSYGTAKAKENSQGLRRIGPALAKSGSILIVLSQSRNAINTYRPTKTYSGGDALKFYATVSVQYSIAREIKKLVNEKDRKVGVTVKAKTIKNRITGLCYDVEYDIYPLSGLDDVGTCVDYLVEENFWPVAKQTIDAKGLGFSGTRDKVIKLIEKRNLENALRRLCGQCWSEIEAASTIKRKNRYTT